MNNNGILIFNNMIVFFIHIAVTILTILQFFILQSMFDFYDSIFPLLFSWPLIFYFLSGYFLAGKVFIKSKSSLINLLSVSLLIILGVVLWTLIFFTEERPLPGSWISIPNFKWVIYTIAFPFSFPLLEYADDKINTLFYILIPVIPTILLWLGIQIKKVKSIKLDTI